MDLIGLWMCKMPVKDGMLVPGVAACCIYSKSVCVADSGLHSSVFWPA